MVLLEDRDVWVVEIVRTVRDDERVAVAVESVGVEMVEMEPLEVEPLEVMFKRVEAALELEGSALEMVLEEYTLAGG